MSFQCSCDLDIKVKVTEMGGGSAAISCEGWRKHSTLWRTKTVFTSLAAHKVIKVGGKKVQQVIWPPKESQASIKHSVVSTTDHTVICIWLWAEPDCHKKLFRHQSQASIKHWVVSTTDRSLLCIWLEVELVCNKLFCHKSLKHQCKQWVVSTADRTLLCIWLQVKALIKHWVVISTADRTLLWIWLQVKTLIMHLVVFSTADRTLLCIGLQVKLKVSIKHWVVSTDDDTLLCT